MSWKGKKGVYTSKTDNWFLTNIKNPKNSWFARYKVEDFIKILGLSDTFYSETKHFMSKIIKIAVKHLNKRLICYEFRVQEIREFDRIDKNGRNNGKIKEIAIWITENNKQNKVLCE